MRSKGVVQDQVVAYPNLLYVDWHLSYCLTSVQQERFFTVLFAQTANSSCRSDISSIRWLVGNADRRNGRTRSLHIVSEQSFQMRHSEATECVGLNSLYFNPFRRLQLHAGHEKTRIVRVFITDNTIMGSRTCKKAR